MMLNTLSTAFCARSRVTSFGPPFPPELNGSLTLELVHDSNELSRTPTYWHQLSATAPSGERQTMSVGAALPSASVNTPPSEMWHDAPLASS